MEEYQKRFEAMIDEIWANQSESTKQLYETMEERHAWMRDPEAVEAAQKMLRNAGMPEGMTLEEYMADAERRLDLEAAREQGDMDALWKFSVNNNDLDTLKSITGAFNPFKILNIQDFEIRHSNVLAWLLDPAAHHGLNDIFKKILLEALRGDRNISSLMNADFSDLEIMREWKNIDIIAVSRRNKLVVVIENKLFAGESENQLEKYARTVDSRYPDPEYRKIFIFLTLDGAEARGSERYVPFTHKQICDIIKSVIKIRRSFMNTQVYDFITQYLEILEEKIMPSNELVALCGRLYRENRYAIKLILDYGKPKLSPESVQKFHRDTGTESIHADKDSVKLSYSFIPCRWSAIVPKTSPYSDKYLVFFHFNFADFENHKVVLSLNIGNFREQEQAERERFVELVDEAIAKSGNPKLKLRKNSKTNNMIYSKIISFKHGGSEYDLEDSDGITEKLIETYNSHEVQNALDVVNEVVLNFDFIR